VVSYKIAFYTVLQSAVDGDILLLPVRVRNVENARIMVAYTSMYSQWRMAFKVVTFVNVTLRACFIAVHVCSGKISFCDLRQRKTGSRYNDAVSCF